MSLYCKMYHRCCPFISNRAMTEETEVQVLLLQLSDEFLLVVQLISQVADLLLVSFTVGVDLLLHRFLNTHTHKYTPLS